MMIRSPILLLLLVAFVAVGRGASAVEEKEVDAEAVLKSIDGVYVYESISGVQPFFNVSSGDWEFSTFREDFDESDMAYYLWARTLKNPRYVVLDAISKESWDMNGTIVPIHSYPRDSGTVIVDGQRINASDIPKSGENICVWPIGPARAGDLSSVYLRCAQTTGVFETHYYLSSLETSIDGGYPVIQSIEGESVEPNRVRAELLAAAANDEDDSTDGVVDDAGAFLTSWRKIAQL